MHSTEAMYQRQKTSLEFEISALWVHHDVSRIRNPSAGYKLMYIKSPTFASVQIVEI